MDKLDLPTIYTTGEFADCTLISSQGEEFPVHRLVIGQFPRLKALVSQDRRVRVPESTEVLERMLRWMYGVEWALEGFQPTRRGVGRELGEFMGVVGAAEKYEIPKLRDAAFASLGDVMGHVESVDAGLRILRDLTDEASTKGTLQRTVIDRMLGLLKEGSVSRASNVSLESTESSLLKDNSVSRQTNASHGADETEVTIPDKATKDEYPDVITVPKKSSRPKKPTEKAKDTSLKPPSTRGAPSKQEEEPKRYCICNRPEDPYLVQCDHCDRFFHPGCLGQGMYKASAYKRRRRYALEADERRFREGDLGFSCLDCDELALSMYRIEEEEG